MYMAEKIDRYLMRMDASGKICKFRKRKTKRNIVPHKLIRIFQKTESQGYALV